ncbi:MAG TPA: Fe-Mn family superoxide dismutase [Sphingobium sp.]|uniref:superoxide dismutase n=1 Tax=Sphingobium sp. TaxID=1912891 RepID=UPI002ED28C96
MSEFDTSRREILTAGTLLAGISAIAGKAVAAPVAAQSPSFTPQPLPFAPASLGWLSEKIITSHHDNNYVGAVKRLGAIRAEFAKLDVATAQGFQINGLKREELIAWNSMILHELYFAGLGAGEDISASLGKAIEQSFGSQDRWAAEFTAMGKALGGGSGWVLLVWSPHDRMLTNQWAADHSMTLACGLPLLALDMYEHAYAMDFGAKAAAYVDGYMKGFSWGNANRLFSSIKI